VLFTVRTPWLLWTLLFATIWVLVTMGPEEVLLPFVTRERFGPDPRLFGFCWRASVPAGWWDRSWSRRCGCRDATLSAMTLVWGLSTLPFVVIGLTHEYWLMAVSGFACGFGFSYGNVIWGHPAATCRATCSGASRA
jgi:DHA3 family tetracycline resistance protein-like MFS transporter